MKRFALLLIGIAVACVVETPRDSRDGDPDAGRPADSGDVDGGEDGGDADGGDVDAGAEDGGEADGGTPDGGSAGYARQWGNGIPLTGLNTGANETDPFVSRDMLRICFSRNSDIYCASRSSLEKTFDPPVAQTNLNTPRGEWFPTLWGDEIYFASDRNTPGTGDIFRAKWSAIAGAYGQPSLVAELDTADHTVSAGISHDGLKLFIETRQPGATGAETDLWVSTRATTSSAWGAPVHVDGINSVESNEWAIRMPPDESFAIFGSGRPGSPQKSWVWLAEASASGGWSTPHPADIRLPNGCFLVNADVLSDGTLIGACNMTGGSYDLYLFTPREPDPPSKYQWGTPVPIAELNAGSGAVQATMTADMLKICFTSDRAGSLGGADIWCATRSSSAAPFGTAFNLTAINTAGEESNPGLSSDGAELFFCTSRSGVRDIYRAVWVPADGTYKFPEAVTALNSPAEDAGPALTSNDLTMIFDSNRSNGDWSIYMAVRPTRSSAFGTPIPQTALNSAYTDGEPGPALDGFRMVFASERPIPPEQGQQPRRLWGVEWANGQWGMPEIVQFDGFTNTNTGGPSLLSDGSLLFNAAGKIYIAPPK